MDTKSLVSVIIPAYNAQEFIVEALNSIIAQTYDNIEIIVVDDGSSDDTSQVVASYDSRVHIYHQSNSGTTAIPRNTGIMHSSGDFLCFLDADDLMVPDRISFQVDFMERYPHVGIVFCDYRNFNKDGFYSESHFQTCPHLWSQLRDQRELILENPCALLAQENFGIAGSIMIRKNTLRFQPGFDLTLRSCEDFHFYYSTARYVHAGVINKVGMMRRIHEKNKTGNTVKMLSEGIHSRTLLRDSEKDPKIRAYLNRYIAGCHGSLARYYADHGQFIQSLRCDLQVLSGPFYWPQLRATCRNITRTIIMASGLHKPKKL